MSMSMTRALRGLIGLSAMLLAVSALAEVPCRALFNQDGGDDVYYALVFSDPEALPDAARLSDQVAPLLSDIARKLRQRAGSKNALQLQLLVCEHRVGRNDFSVDEVRQFLGRQVVAVLWKSQEGSQPGLVQLALPVYLQAEDASRREVEVVTVFSSSATNPTDGWIEVLGQDSASYKPFVAMGLAAAYQSRGDYKLAWVALCDARSSLAALSAVALRPNRAELDSAIAARLALLMNELERSAAKAGVTGLPACNPQPALTRAGAPVNF